MKYYAKKMKKPARPFVIIILALVIITYLNRFQQPANLNAQIDTLIQSYVDNNRFSGTVLIAENGELILHRAYGQADILGAVSNTTQTRYPLAAVSKLFTKTAILHLVKAGLLNLGDPLSKYIPFPNGDRITIGHLIYHTSGLPDVYSTDPRYFQTDFIQPVSLEQLLSRFRNVPHLFEPGTQIKYSSAGYVVLAAVIEQVTGMDYGEYLQEQFFCPFGLQSTESVDSVHHSSLALGYRLAGNSPECISGYDMSSFIGMGNLVSTCEDLFAWDNALYDSTIYPISFLRNMTSISQFGHLPGYQTAFMRIPTHQILVVILSNYDHSPLRLLLPQITTLLLQSRVIDLPETSLLSLVGEYEGRLFDRIPIKLEIRKPGHHLTMAFPGLDDEAMTVELHPESKSRFLAVVAGNYLNIIATFAMGTPDHLRLNISGWEIDTKRIDKKGML